MQALDSKVFRLAGHLHVFPTPPGDHIATGAEYQPAEITEDCFRLPVLKHTPGYSEYLCGLISQPYTAHDNGTQRPPWTASTV